MKLPAEVIKDVLSGLGEWTLLNTDPSSFYGFPRQYDGSFSGAGHTLVLPEGTVPENTVLPEGTLAVLSAPAGRQEPLPREGTAMLIPDRRHSPREIMSRLAALYDRIEAWEEKLDACSFDMSGVQRMLDISSLEMRGSFGLVDESYNMPAYTKADLRTAGMRNIWHSGRLSDEVTAQLAADPQMTWVRSAAGVQEYENYMADPKEGSSVSLFRNMFRSGESSYYNRLLFANRTGIYSPTIRFMTEELARRIERITRHLPTFSLPVSEKDVLRRYLVRMARSDSVPEGEAAKALSFTGWKMSDSVRFFIFRSMYPERDAGISDYILRRLEDLIPASCGVLDGDAILLLQNTARSGDTLSALRPDLVVFLTENLYRAGISNEIPDFRHARGAYLQAEAALRLGEKKDPMYWYFLFENYLLDYLTEKASSELPGELLTLPRIGILLSWDAEHGTSLTETLRAYTAEGFNVTHAARRLYIHRTSLQDRLDRIRSLTGLDLEDEKTRFLLQWSFYLREGGSM